MSQWAPLVPRSLGEQPLAEITRQLKSAPPGTDAGLLTGRAGIVLFFLYYAQFTGKADDQAYAESLVADLFATLPEEMPFTFCSGLAGIAWLLRHAVATGLIDTDPDEALSDIDGLLRERMVAEMRAGSFDFLHGALGCALYFLEIHQEPRARVALVETLDALEQHARGDAAQASWVNPFTEASEETRGGISLGLAHGMPSVINVLQRYIDAGIEPERTTPLRERAIGFLLAKRLDADSPSCFPTFSGIAALHGASRLAWCYGDPGVAATLWQAGHDDEALAALQRASTRDVESAGVIDLSLCHGSVGLALIFARAANRTADPSFAVAARRWLEDGFVRIAATTDVSMLTGLAGAGLAVLALASHREPSWDRALLLS